MDERRVLKIMAVTLRAGELLVGNGVSVADSTTVLRRVTTALGLRSCEVVINLNQITLSYLPPELDHVVTVVRVVEPGAPRLYRLVAVEEMVQRLETGELGLEGAWDELDVIERSEPPYRLSVREAANLLSVAGWVIFAGGALLSAMIAVVAAAVARPAVLALWRTPVPEVFVTFVGSATVVAVPYAFGWAGVDFPVSPAVIGGLYAYLPGAALVASVNDGLSGALTASLARGLQAVIVAVGVALGVLVMLEVAATLDISLPDARPTRWHPALSALAASVAVAGLAVARSVPRRVVATAALLAATAWLVSWAVGDAGANPQVATAAAAGVLGFGSGVLARLQRAVSSIYAGIAVLVLVPGTTIYMAMVFFATDLVDEGLSWTMRALGISGAIAAGVTLGLLAGRSIPRPPPVRVRRPARGDARADEV